jgi:glycosyltransferase involved in cell wall biosynthesis
MNSNKIRVCLIVGCYFLPELRYGRPYVYSLAFKQLGYDVTVLSPSPVSGLKETRMEFGSVIPFKESSIVKLFGVEEPLQVAIKALKVQADVYYVFAPVPTFAAILLKLLGKHVIYDIGDDNPSLFTETLIRKVPKLALIRNSIEKSLRALEGNMLKLFDYNTTLTDSLTNDKLSYVQKVVTVHYATHPLYHPKNTDRQIQTMFKDKYTLVYIGEISKDKGLDVMLETTNILFKKGIPIRLLLIGSFCQPHTCEMDKKYFKDFLQNNGLQDIVTVTGWIPYKEVPKYATVGSIGFVLIDPWCYSYKISIPDKAIDILSCGLPIIGTSETTEIKHLINKSKAGLLVNCANASQIANALEALFSNESSMETLKKNAELYASKYHSLRELCRNLSNTMAKISIQEKTKSKLDC